MVPVTAAVRQHWRQPACSLGRRCQQL